MSSCVFLMVLLGQKRFNFWIQSDFDLKNTVLNGWLEARTASM
jgi:hypothetical protein